MSDTEWTVIKYLEVFFPQYFDRDGEEYVPPDILEILIDVSEGSRPSCLPEKTQNLAQAFFTAYLINVRNSGFSAVPIRRGDVASEREGDVAISYQKIESREQTSGPPLTPWDQWYALWKRCNRAAIITRYGDPWQNQSRTRIVDGRTLSSELVSSARVQLQSE